ncbi:MAG: serine/threonine protein kinase [Deltaproteobacteria bacterium]|nr:serine/threonine protein kinase [Deltaproteobacteria bacterium]
MGTEFGRYTIVKPVGSGGMAEVHLARQVGYGGFVKPCVLKRISPRFRDDERVLQMFLEEARISALLNHPNIVQTFDFGEVDGIPFMAMELVDGVNLLVWMKKRADAGQMIPLRSAVEIVAVLLDALAYAHSLADLDGRPLNVVHRDVSPQNVLLSREGGLKLADFGIARHEARDQHTQGTVTKGKPGYMAPEASLGDAVDGRADVYAAGVVLVELISLEKFHTADTPFGGLAGIRKRVDERLGRRPQVPLPLVELIHRLTAIDPDERPDAQHAAAELRAVAAELPKTKPLVEYLRATVGEAVEVQPKAEDAGPTPPSPRGVSPLDERGWPTFFGNEELKSKKDKEAPPPPPKPLTLGRGASQGAQAQGEGGAKEAPRGKLPMPAKGSVAQPAGAQGAQPGVRAPEVKPGMKGTPLDLNGVDVGLPKSAAQRMIEREREARRTLTRRVLIVVVLAAAFYLGPMAAEKFKSPPPPKPTSGKLVVSSSPAGAEIRINDIPHERRTPATIADLPLAVALEVRVSKAGYAARVPKFVVTIPEDVAEAKLDVELEPSARFEVVSDPPGATVRVGAESIPGTTPLGFDLAVGKTATVTITAPGRLPHVVFVNAGKPGTETLTASLELARRIELSSEPTNAFVSLDGRPVGRTPLDVDIPADKTIVLTVDYPGHQRDRRTIDPKRPPPPKLEVKLKAVPFEKLELLPSERKRFSELNRAYESARRDRADIRARISSAEARLAKMDFSTPMEVQARAEESLERLKNEAVELEGAEEEARDAIEALRTEVVNRIESTAR